MNMKEIKTKSNLGGKRPGSGRPKGSGKYRETTRPIRVPAGLMENVQDLLAEYQQHLSIVNTGSKPGKASSKKMESSTNNGICFGENVFRPVVTQPRGFPLYGSKVAAGFPSPADDYIESKLDLNQYLVKRPAATFFVRVEGESMIKAGIHPDDILVVDRSIKPSNGKIVIAVLNGELTVKRLKINGKAVSLLPENDHFQPIMINDEMNFSIWGVVTNVIHSV